MTQQNLLPTFAGAKAGEARPPGDASTVEEAAPKSAPVDLAATAVSEGVCATSEVVTAKVDPFLEATKKLRPFGSWFKNPFARAAARPQEKQPVQTELSLDSVKPVRNDLTEAEVELGRPARQAAIQPAAPKAPMGAPALPAASTGGVWQRLTAPLFGGSDSI
jgi:hypothetical protein